jgi:hypothetical protein
MERKHQVQARPISPPVGILAAALLASALLVAAMLGGCTSDVENLVGTELPQAGFDSLLVPLGVDSLRDFGVVNVTLSPPFLANEVLYFGIQGQERSSIITGYDFADLDTSLWNERTVRAENIQRVWLVLYMLSYYTSLLPSDLPAKGLVKSYEVRELVDPPDSAAMAALYPGSPPPPTGAVVNPASLSPQPAGSEIQLELDEETFLRWFHQGTRQGVLVSQGDTGESDAGLIGFASTEMAHPGSTMDPTLVGTLVGPALHVEFIEPDTVAGILPYLDTDTEQLAPVPTEPDTGFVLRTHVRSYPFFSFSLDSLPPNVFINRAVLVVAVDSTRSYGPLGALVVTELKEDRLPGSGPVHQATLDDLEAATREVTALTSVAPHGTGRLEFRITSSLQRHVNGLLTGPLHLLLAAGEDFYPDADVEAVDPDFYLRRYTFQGTQAPDSLRPHLRITYTRLAELERGGS